MRGEPHGHECIDYECMAWRQRLIRMHLVLAVYGLGVHHLVGGAARNAVIPVRYILVP
jgi:hypothetical protein